MEDTMHFGGGVPRYVPGIAIGTLSRQMYGGKSNYGIEALSGRYRLERKLTQLRGVSAPWAVRNQRHRGTCNAFATVAAEELFRALAGTGSVDPLSEEYLHSRARSQGLDRIPQDLSDAELERLDRDGGTFLGQVMDALIEGSLADAADVPYEPDRGLRYVVSNVATAHVSKAWARKVVETDLAYDITDAEVGKDREWKYGTRRENLAAFFADRLAKDIPVVAAFAILEGAEYVWSGHHARASGHVRYPHDAIVGADPGDRWSRRPVAGHSVCLLGYAPNPDGDEEDPGTFLFRNSYGTEIFGADADARSGRLNAELPGYGTISAADVGRYCWEYLTRASVEDVERLRSAPPRLLDI